MNENLLNLILNILGIVVTAAAAAFIPKVKQWLNAHVDQKHLDIAKTIAGDLVKWAEQTMQTAAGKDKLAAVLDALRTALANRGIVLTDAEVNAIVEAAVHTAKQVVAVAEGAAPVAPVPVAATSEATAAK